MPNLIHNQRLRSAFWQAVALLLVVLAVWIAVHNTAANLERQGIASGFGFLSKTAGFDIIQHLIPYDEQATYGRAFAVALLNTILVSAAGVFFATILGFVLGVARLSHNFLVSRLAFAYVETVRNVPLLLQLFIWYFAVLRTLPSPRESYAFGGAFFLNIRGLYAPSATAEPGLRAVAVVSLTLAAFAFAFVRWGKLRHARTGRSMPFKTIAVFAWVILSAIAFVALGSPLVWTVPELRGFNFVGGWTLLPELVALLAALTVYTAAFIGEIVRAGILSVGIGQWEASEALGLSRAQVLRLVVIPQAMRVIVPPMTSQYLNLTKNSSLAAAIAYPDLVLVFAGTVLMQTGQAVEVICLTMLVYLAMSLSISYVMNRYNRKIALVER